MRMAKVVILAAMAVWIASCTALLRMRGPYDDVTPDNPVPVRVHQ